MAQADIGLIGLAVMGQNLVMNMNDNGYTVCVYNRTQKKTDDFMDNAAKGSSVIPAYSVQECISQLTSPRKIMIMVKAGNPVDALIDECILHLEKGDIIIDGGNSHFEDSERRSKRLEELGMHFVGAGISGGEEGARHGPSIMPGGSLYAWNEIKDIFTTIAAKSSDNQPCCDYVGEGGAGHYVKMVHNGIEYGDMQIICEAYHIMKSYLKMSNDDIADTFAQYNLGPLESYLIEITSHICRFKENDSFLLDSIKDTAGQKGTGKWTGISALSCGVPLTLIGEAVFARCLSSRKDERVGLSKIYTSDEVTFSGDKKEFLLHLEKAIYAAKIISYTQGFMLLQQSAIAHDWNLQYGSIALMWRGGCIIRSVFLKDIKAAYDNNPQLQSLLHDAFFIDAMKKNVPALRNVVVEASLAGKAIPCLSTSLSFFDGYTCEILPANLLQAQRDYFGAHTYQRLDKDSDEFHHTNWTGSGGNISSSTYNA